MKYSSDTDYWVQYEPDPAFARRAKIIIQNLRLRGKERILDVGCGRGFYGKLLTDIQTESTVYGVDLKFAYLSAAEKITIGSKVKLIQGDASALPTKDSSFDRIIASEVLEHVEDDEEVIAEITRTLKPKGIAILTVPNKNYPFLWDPLNWILERLINKHIPSQIWWLAGIWADHRRLYDGKELITKLKQTGLRIENVWKTTRYCFPFSHLLLYGIGKNLVEKGWCPSFNRFVIQEKPSWVNKIALWPLRIIDKLNQVKDNDPSVNIIVKVSKI